MHQNLSIFYVALAFVLSVGGGAVGAGLGLIGAFVALVRLCG